MEKLAAVENATQADAPVLALTFDDGPDPHWTPAVLERLAAVDAHATFFVLGARVREHPAIVDAIVAAGHTVGLHGDLHLDHSVSQPVDIVLDTDRALETLAERGVRPALWRLPWGRAAATSAQLALDHGMRIIGWDGDTHDWRGDGWEAQPAQVRRIAQTGGTILLHDAIGPGARRTGCENTLELVDALCRTAADQGIAVQAMANTREVHGA